MPPNVSAARYPYTASQDLHDAVVEYAGAHPDDVLQIDDEVSAHEDVTAVVTMLADAGRAPVLRLPRVTGSVFGGRQVPVVTNLFASRQRLARFLGCEPAGLHATYQRRARALVDPRDVGDGPVTDVVTAGDAVDVRDLPMLTHFATDLGPYLTSGIVVAEGTDGGAGNLSYHRATPADATSLALSLHSRGHLWRLLQRSTEAGRALPVAMVVGGHPLFMLAASARVPESVDERQIAGGLFGAPLDVVRTPVHGIAVPASADFVLEGTIAATDHAPEGPFGEFSGYSSNRSTHNVLRVQTLMTRRDSWWVDVVGGNSAEHLTLARLPREAEMAEQLTSRFPEVTGLHYPSSGTHFHAYVGVRQLRPGQARQVLLALMGWDPYLKTVIAVDPDVDITRDEHVLWAMATHVQPDRDVFVVGGLPGSPLDPSSSMEGTTSRMGIDATRAPGFEGTRIVTSPEATRRAQQLLAGVLP